MPALGDGITRLQARGRDRGRDVQQFAIGVLGRPGQQREGDVGTDLVAFHQDALRLPDDVPVHQRHREAVLALGADHRDGRVAGEQQAVVLGFGIERIGAAGVQVQRTQVLLVYEQLKAHHRQHAEAGGAGSEQRPPLLAAQIVGPDGRLLPRRAQARTLPDLVLDPVDGLHRRVGRRWGADGAAAGDQGDAGEIGAGDACRGPLHDVLEGLVDALFRLKCPGELAELPGQACFGGLPLTGQARLRSIWIGIAHLRASRPGMWQTKYEVPNELHRQSRWKGVYVMTARGTSTFRAMVLARNV